MAELGFRPRLPGFRVRCEGDSGSVIHQVTAQGFHMRHVKCFSGLTSLSFPLEEGLLGICLPSSLWGQHWDEQLGNLLACYSVQCAWSEMLVNVENDDNDF